MRSLFLVAVAATAFAQPAFADDDRAPAPAGEAPAPASLAPAPTTNVAPSPTTNAAPAPAPGSTVRSDEPVVRARDAQTGVREGTFLPQTLSARIGDQRVMALALAGYDTTAGQGALFQTVVEGAIV